VQAVKYMARIDKSQQPMLVFKAGSTEKRPLLVGLHTWSGSYTQAGGQTVYARWCIEKDWHFIHPDFRGPNWTPDACGSEKVVQDIIDAVNHMTAHHNVDTRRVYLVGGSGGGHAALLMAGRAPQIWAGVSAWVPISDIHIWWKQKDAGKHSEYARHIEKAVGGRPDESSEARQKCVKRSPNTYLQKASSVSLDINAGVADGHSGGSVPFTHSLYAFNQVVSEKSRIDPELIQDFYRRQALPAGVEKAVVDSLYGEKTVIFRNVYKNARVTIFKGGHEIVHHAALNWLSQQRKGEPANWNVTSTHVLKTTEDEGKSGK